MSAHTPGPWRMFKSGENMSGNYSQPFGVSTLSPAAMPTNGNGSTEVICGCFGDTDGGLIAAEANARLIAAAPELLEALKYARRMVKASECDVAFIDDAIAKATGAKP